MSGVIKLEKGQYLFREGDPSDAMYVIKTGRIAITKPSTGGEIELAQLAPGAMLGEMAFFDNKPRSASAKALQITTIIKLPFSGLHAQFKAFPEWSKAIMRTVNEHLRNANKRIQELEKQNKEDPELFSQHTMNKFISIIAFVGLKWGKPTNDGGVEIPQERLRKYTIQVFQEATHKMDKLTEALADMGHMTVENLGEGVKRIVIKNLDFFFQFVEWHNKWLFSKPADQILVKENEIRLLKALVFYGASSKPDEKGMVKVSLTQMQNESMKDLNDLVKIDDINPLVEKKLIPEKEMSDKGGVFTYINLKEMKALIPYWEIIYQLRKIRR